MNQIKQQTKQSKKNTVIVAVIALVTATMIFTMVSSYVIAILDVQAKSRHALDLPLKTQECKHDTTEAPSCKNNEGDRGAKLILEYAPVVDHIDNDGDDRDSSNAPYDPNKCIPGNECPPRCQEGWIPATPPLNPQLGCLPDSITSNPGVQPGEDDDGVLQSDDETTRGENEDLSSMLSATPSTVQDSPEQEDEDDVDVDEDDVKEEEVERNNEDGNVK
ncbi:MAG: hypothetical protein ACRD5E_07945 [Nitrososphaeraceae archaeon]